MPRILENIFLLPFRVELSPKGQVLLLKFRVRYAFGQNLRIFTSPFCQSKMPRKIPEENVLIFILFRPLHEGPHIASGCFDRMLGISLAAI